MVLSSEGRVGSKGELFPPKQIRERAGLTPSKKILFRIEDDKLIVEPIRSLDELMNETPNVEISMAEFKGDRRELSKKAES
jgi:bifunctional DNA-binding transcriptional regulator/antitoxin component of YhaV-PrlF toxin-antitoxin module